MSEAPIILILRDVDNKQRTIVILNTDFVCLIEKTLMPSPPPALIRLDRMLTKIKSNIYVLHNLDPLPFWKGDSEF